MNNIDEDTSTWLGCPTPLEMYKHQCALLEDELTTAYRLLSKARANVAGLVQMNDLLATGKAAAEAEATKLRQQVGTLNFESSQKVNQIYELKMIASQNDLLFRENQRLLLELNVLRGPRP
ncbi:hypothetical protein EXW72_08170 [Pseudomonas sp. BCA14]|uniref:hypothetical protein n=1 Tax=unclassified Pseudomonas TaxID=196821 RepID=UPI00106E6A06|nr:MULTISPECIES: hypothetical protein [unclassified Pseudomonas]TFF13756.1 hypothetical protein EXW70_04320 [Pseudomonas sp. JMN1]TFF15561.1 hypothetical protein EXW71_04720 [Pseudomonas sp. BCA17]TFF31968.1 hypothetical protein EXW72_08170 [Pseudomonas sp. BCA14]TFF32921.1 hypothetical protein EXW73_03970 [Pseudomonas sp. BCA13]